MSSLDAIVDLVAEDFLKTNEVIERSLCSEVPLVNELGAYIIHSGGKRLRPLLVLLCARAAGYTGNQHPLLAAVIEFIHTATLLHDDVVDDSGQRRGKLTANRVWSNSASVLVGDFLYSRAFEMMVESGCPSVMGLMAKTTNEIAQGEVLQLAHRHQLTMTREIYWKIIHAKTATLFSAATQLGAHLLDSPPEFTKTLGAFGEHLGCAYQLVDDVLDYKADPATLGKNLGDDLREGKMTLPLMIAWQNSPCDIKDLISAAITEGNISALPVIQDAINTTHAIDEALQLAQHEAHRASECLQILKPSPYKEALESLVYELVYRNF